MAGLVRLWLETLGSQTLFIEPGDLSTSGYAAQARDDLRNREIFYPLAEGRALIERWHRQYNTVRPDSALGCRPPAPSAKSSTPLRGVGVVSTVPVDE